MSNRIKKNVKDKIINHFKYYMGKDSVWELHNYLSFCSIDLTLIEREQFAEAVSELVNEGLLTVIKVLGADAFKLTEKGKEEIYK